MNYFGIFFIMFIVFFSGLAIGLAYSHELYKLIDSIDRRAK